MGRKDILAAGGRKAAFGVSGRGDDEIKINPGIIAPEGAFDNEVIPEIVKEIKTLKKFTPLGETLLVRRTPADNPGGILLTETVAKEAPAEGTVLAVGPRVYQLVVGDNVVFGKYAGAEFTLNGETLLLMEVDEIKGTLSDESRVEPEPYINDTACSVVPSRFIASA